MKQELKALSDLQAIDTKLATAKKALAALDAGAALKQGLAQTETILANRAAALHKSQAELKESELKLSSLESKKKDFEAKLYAGKVTNPKELSGIQQELAMIKRNREKLDERILELYEVIEQQKKPVQEAEERREQFKTRLEQVLAQQKSKNQALTAEIAELTAEREKAVTALPKQLLSKYEMVSSRTGGVGIAPLTDGRCGGCKTAVTPFIQRKLREGTEYQFCESCGRFLYLE